MNIDEALAYVRDNWAELKKKQEAIAAAEPYQSIPGEDCVWFVSSDMATSFDVDHEAIGMRSNGALVWAYASGCSCWDGEYEIHQTHDLPEFKAFVFNHEGMTEDWEKRVIAFAEKATGRIEDVSTAQPE